MIKGTKVHCGRLYESWKIASGIRDYAEIRKLESGSGQGLGWDNWGGSDSSVEIKLRGRSLERSIER